MFMERLIKRELVTRRRRDWGYVAFVCILFSRLDTFFFGVCLTGIIAILYWEYSVIVSNLCSQDWGYFLSARVPVLMFIYEVPVY